MSVREATRAEIWTKGDPWVLYIMSEGDRIKIGISRSMKRRLKDLSRCTLEKAYVVEGMNTRDFERLLINRLSGGRCCWTTNTVDVAVNALRDIERKFQRDWREALIEKRYCPLPLRRDATALERWEAGL